MNIFVTDPDPVKCAIALDDVRVTKMILESAQLLSNAVHEHAIDLAPLVYRKASFNHPCAKWARLNRSNYQWLLKHCTALMFEKLYRNQHPHSSMTLLDTFRETLQMMPEGPQTPFANCSSYKDDPIYTAYRKTLLKKWVNAKVPGSRSWTKREPPHWLNGKTTKTGEVTILVIEVPSIVGSQGDMHA